MTDGQRIGRGLRRALRAARSAYRVVANAVDRIRAKGVAGFVSAARRRVSASAGEGFGGGGQPERGTRFDVIYAIGYVHGEPKRYRVFNAADGLRARGYAVHIVPCESLEDICHYEWDASVLVLFRAEDDPLIGVAQVLAYAHRRGMRIVYDIDDLVFDAGLIDQVDALRSLTTREKTQFQRTAVSRLRLLRKAELVMVTTGPLARAVERCGIPAEVVPNSLNVEQERLAAELRSRPRGGSQVRIGYFSGSATHQRDFQECEDALLDVMDEFPDVVFRLVGYLDLGARWARHARRVERFGFMPAMEMLRCLAEVDINLAPLEISNAFCEAKSELKFFEAAIVDVPTIASATEPMIAAIEHGVSGFVARTREEWLPAMRSLLENPQLRKDMGAAARQHALLRFGLARVTEQRVKALGLGTPSLSREGRSPRT